VSLPKESDNSDKIGTLGSPENFSKNDFEKDLPSQDGMVQSALSRKKGFRSHH